MPQSPLHRISSLWNAFSALQKAERAPEEPVPHSCFICKKTLQQFACVALRYFPLRLIGRFLWRCSFGFRGRCLGFFRTAPAQKSQSIFGTEGKPANRLFPRRAEGHVDA